MLQDARGIRGVGEKLAAKVLLYRSEKVETYSFTRIKYIFFGLKLLDDNLIIV